jgi:cell division protein FtsB
MVAMQELKKENDALKQELQSLKDKEEVKAADDKYNNTYRTT